MIFVVDEEGNLVYAFWDDATSRNNYKYFGDLISFDSTYSTNQYNMIFAFFYWSEPSFAKCIFWRCLLIE
jgi:hypothetical protein